MRLRQWYSLRGPGFVWQRGATLLRRYALSPRLAQQRVAHALAAMQQFGCEATLPTPGSVVERYPLFVRSLQDAGAEIAVHSYDHIDLRACPPSEAVRQLVRAANALRRQGIEVHGFRSPYLRCSNALLQALPRGLLGYSSNQAVFWDVLPSHCDRSGTVFSTISSLYRPASALYACCVPWTRSGILEIPVSLPDDLQLLDGLGLSEAEVGATWARMLALTYERGESLTLLLHPELGARCEQPLATVLAYARSLRPRVWVARLRDIAQWWREKAAFTFQASRSEGELTISFDCSERATILVRTLHELGPGCDWFGAYRCLRGRTLTVPAEPLPFVGLPAAAPQEVVSYLRDQGYLLEIGAAANRCATAIDGRTLARLTTHVQLIEYIERASTPLVRFWRWPHGARSALAVTGDLDALSLLDYASRLFAHQ